MRLLKSAFVLYEALNGDDIYNAIDDTSYANHIVTKSEAYSIAKAEIKEEACGWYFVREGSESSLRNIDYNLEKTSKNDEGYVFHITGETRGYHDLGYRVETEYYVYDLNVSVSFGGHCTLDGRVKDKFTGDAHRTY